MNGYVTTRWGQVHYRGAGSEGPTLVLFHESPLSSAVYEAVLPILGRSLRTFAFDTPGYGLSSLPPVETEIPDYAATLLEAAQNLGLESFAVAGVHTGASLALQVALQGGSDVVTHVILSGVPVLTAEARAEYLANWAPEVTPDATGAHFQWAWERYQRIWDGPTEMINLGATILLSNLEHYNWAYNAAFRYDPEPDLTRLAVPTLFLTAERDLLIGSDRRAVEIVPNPRLKVVPDLPGQLPMRVPDAFAREVVEFLQGVG